MQRRALYVSPIDMRQNNGMAQLQIQLLRGLSDSYEQVDLLSLGATPRAARRWVSKQNLRVSVLHDVFAWVAALNGIAWYIGGAVLCNKLRWIESFRFPLRTPLPRSWFDRYDVILCHYIWTHCLLRLERAGDKVVMETGDVMADRHERIGARRWISLASADERAVLTSGCRCVAVSQDDIDEFKKLYGVEMPMLQFVPPMASELMHLSEKEKPARVGFIGAPSFGNEQIIELLASPDFLGRLKEAGVQLIVAGEICNSVRPVTIQALEQGGARVLGVVPSILQFYEQVSAVLNPVGPSTGVKIKSVETLMAGRVLITTRWGADVRLSSAFPNQVIYVEWPISAAALAEITIRAIREKPIYDTSAPIEDYLRTSDQRLRSLLVPQKSRA